MSAVRKPLVVTNGRLTVSVGLPSIVVVVLSLVAGGLQVVNELVLKGDPQIQGVIAVFLIFLVGIGITPARGAAFRNALHLPDWATTVVTAVISAAGGALQVAGLGTTAHTIILTALTVLAALGFGISQGSLVPVPAPAAPVAPRARRSRS